MTTSFYNSISGLMSFQQGIDIWGDNIANINTVGFKEKNPEYDTVFSKALSSAMGSSDVGMGSTVAASALDLSQGSLIQTQNKFDLAIGGRGWLAVDHAGERFYTRNGAFYKDAEGYLVNDSGDYLLVANANNLIKQNDGSYILDSTKKLPDITTAPLSPISLPDNVILPAVPTQNVSLTSNLNDDTQIATTKPASANLSFSALYDKDGVDLHMRDSQNLVFGFGNEVTYNSGTLSSTFCINDDEKDGEDLNIDFTLNSKEIKLTLPDGSNRKTILKALSEELSKNGFENSISKDSITINSQDKFILKSNDDIFPSTAAAVMTFKNEPKGEFEFATPDEFAKEIQTLANTAYAGKTKVDFQNGEFVISNLSNETLNAYALNANNTNENFLTNLGRLGNVVYPKTDAKSLLFNSNSQTFGGKIIDQNGNTDIISFEFTKTKVQNNNISWIGNIKILNDSGVLTETKQEFIFDSTGLLISPKNLTLNAPQNININFNLSSFAKNTTKTTYSFSQDGIEEGYLKDYQIDSNGVISALFSNSRAEALGQIPLFHFQNEQGLDSVGGNLFKETSNSNKAFLYQKDGTYIPGGQIISGSLENSNVNMTTAMTELIVTQKAFSASAKTVTTSDEMIQKAINLKR